MTVSVILILMSLISALAVRMRNKINSVREHQTNNVSTARKAILIKLLRALVWQRRVRVEVELFLNVNAYRRA